MPQIRPASPDDAAAIARIDQLCNGWPAERIRERIRESLEQPSEDWAVFVAEDGQELLGYARCARLEYKAHPQLPEGWYLNGVSVVPQHRRKGIASRLVQRRLEYLQGREDTVYYFTAKSNTASQALHEGFGFVKDIELEVPQRKPDLSVSHQSGILYRLYL